MAITLCGNCNTIIDELANTPIETRIPCPSCGSTNRLYNVSLEGSLKLYSKLKYKAKHEGKTRAFLEGTIGDDLYRKLQRWMRLERIIDRDNNLYREVVTDPTTGEEIHRNQEYLSQHTGHGDDKKNRMK